MRQLEDLTADERSAYEVWRSKLADRTLSAMEHDECRREIDNLLWKGPNAQVLALREEIVNIQARLDRLEFHAGLNDNVAPSLPPPDAPSLPPVVASGTIQKMGLQDTATFTVTDSVTGAPVDVSENAPPSQRTGGAGQTAEKTENRGRKKLQFIPEKHPTGGWMILNREASGEGKDWVETTPFKTRKDAKAISDDLNRGVIPKFLRGITVRDFTPAEGETVDPVEGAPIIPDSGDIPVGESIPQIGTPLASNVPAPDAPEYPPNPEADTEDPLADLGF